MNALLERLVKSRLGTKSILAVVTLLAAISVSLTFFFVSRQRSSLTEELRKRALSLASNVAFNSQYAVLSRDIDNLQTLLSGVKKESDIEEAFITDMDGVIIAHKDATRMGEQIVVPAIADSTAQQVWIPTEHSSIWRTVTLIEIERNPADSDEILLFSPPKYETHSEGYVILDVSLESMNRALSAGTQRAVMITLIMIVVGALAVIYMVRSVAGPIYHLADATRAVAQGDLDQAVPIKRSDEIGVLADSFNHMIVQLKVSRGKIEAWNRELESKVTERTKELEEKHTELEQAYEALKTLDKAKDDFLSLVSHELRTPLSSILLYSEMLLDGLATSETDRTEFLATIAENCKRLTRLINDVLDLSKIEAGRMPFKQEELKIKELVVAALGNIRPALETHGLSFDHEEVGADCRVWADRDKIIQVLTNILSNAVKYTPESGKIKVSSTPYDNRAEIAISDTGKGIKQEDIPKVFDRFSQLENIDHHSEGTGLGMTISKSIVERLGGQIWIESEVGKGTTVSFTLPTTPCDSVPDAKVQTYVTRSEQGADS